jgi:hypothetical protein
MVIRKNTSTFEILLFLTHFGLDVPLWQSEKYVSGVFCSLVDCSFLLSDLDYFVRSAFDVNSWRRSPSTAKKRDRGLTSPTVGRRVSRSCRFGCPN